MTAMPRGFFDYRIASSFSRVYIVFGLVLLAKCFVVGQTCDSMVGIWINQDSSILDISKDTEGKLVGHYQSNASDDESLFLLLGLVNRSGKMPTLSFAVSWEDYGSITTWSGYCKEEDEGPVLETMWHLVRPYVDYDWERFVTNTSTFKPLSWE